MIEELVVKIVGGVVEVVVRAVVEEEEEVVSIEVVAIVSVSDERESDCSDPTGVLLCKRVEVGTMVVNVDAEGAEVVKKVVKAFVMDIVVKLVVAEVA